MTSVGLDAVFKFEDLVQEFFGHCFLEVKTMKIDKEGRGSEVSFSTRLADGYGV